MYIRSSTLLFGVIPRKYKCILVAFSKVSGFLSDSESEIIGKDIKEKHIELGNVWGDYDKKVLEEFFVDVFKTFIKTIKKEIEIRRHIASND